MFLQAEIVLDQKYALAFWLLGLLAWLVRTGLLAVGFAVVEVAWSRRNVARAPLLLGVAALFGVLAAALLFLGSGVV